MEKSVAIFLNGNIYDGKIEGDFIIAVDGGYKELNRLKIKPHLIIGDLDSICIKLDNSIDVIRYNIEKDLTDGELAIQYAIENGYNKIFIYGAEGGRLDHILGNITLLKKCLNNNAQGIIKTNDGCLYLTNKNFKLNLNIGDLISLVPYSDDVHIISTTGLKYPLKDHFLEKGFNRGISNVALEKEIEVLIEGEVLIFHSQKKL